MGVEDIVAGGEAGSINEKLNQVVESGNAMVAELQDAMDMLVEKAGQLARHEALMGTLDDPGHIKIGKGFERTEDGTVNVVGTKAFELDLAGHAVPATADAAGHVKPDGETLSVDADGTLRVRSEGTTAARAGAAEKLVTARSIALSGGATGTATAFDGTANISIPVTGLDVSKATAGTLPVARGGTGRTDGKVAALATARTIDGVSFNGSANVTHYTTCSTEAATVEKVVTLAGFVLTTGARVMVRFTVTNTAANPTLNVNATGAKPIQYRNAALAAGYLAANRTYEFVYDGSSYEVVGDINTDANNKVGQYVTTDAAEYPLLTAYTAALAANKTDAARFSSAVTLNPSTKTITATTFKGELVGNAATATTATNATKWNGSGLTRSTAAPTGGADNDVWLQYM